MSFTNLNQFPFNSQFSQNSTDSNSNQLLPQLYQNQTLWNLMKLPTPNTLNLQENAKSPNSNEVKSIGSNSNLDLFSNGNISQKILFPYFDLNQENTQNLVDLIQFNGNQDNVKERKIGEFFPENIDLFEKNINQLENKKTEVNPSSFKDKSNEKRKKKKKDTSFSVTVNPKNLETRNEKALSSKRNRNKISSYNEANYILNQKLPSFLGTKEEYEKFFKADEKEFSPISETEQALVDFVNKPRKRKTKVPVIKSKTDFLSKFRRKLDKDVKEYLSQYDSDLINIKKDRRHAFMSDHFPEMYESANFFYFIKKFSNQKNYEEIIKKENKKKMSVHSKFKKIWSTSGIDSKEIDDYLYLCERLWPIKTYNFSQEISLQLLKEESFKKEKALKIVGNHEKLKKLLKNKNLEVSKMKEGF